MKTNVIVKDGETIIIGGLFRNVVTTTRSQVPLLGDLPWVGGLFRGTSDSNQREEVIVLLTTRIIDPPSGAEGHESAEDIRRKTEGAKDELQSMSRTRMAEDAYEKAARFYLEGDIVSAMKELKIALKLRPAFLEALRLKERITAEREASAKADTVENAGVEESIDQSEASTWSKK
jgi:type IV pilus assembly protein PilQ